MFEINRLTYVSILKLTRCTEGTKVRYRRKHWKIDSRPWMTTFLHRLSGLRKKNIHHRISFSRFFVFSVFLTLHLPRDNCTFFWTVIKLTRPIFDEANIVSSFYIHSNTKVCITNKENCYAVCEGDNQSGPITENDASSESKLNTIGNVI